MHELDKKTALVEHQKLNARQKRFCELHVEGKSKREAYSIAYAKPLSEACEASATQLLKRQDIQHYIDTLRQPLVVESMLSLEDKRSMLKDVVKVDVLALVSDEGEIDLAAARKLPPHCVQEFVVTVRHDKNGGVTRTVKVKFLDKMRAIEVDNALAGHGQGENAGSNNPASDEVLAARAVARAKVRHLLKGINERGLLPSIRIIDTPPL